MILLASLTAAAHEGEPRKRARLELDYPNRTCSQGLVRSYGDQVLAVWNRFARKYEFQGSGGFYWLIAYVMGQVGFGSTGDQVLRDFLINNGEYDDRVRSSVRLPVSKEEIDDLIDAMNRELQALDVAGFSKLSAKVSDAIDALSGEADRGRTVLNLNQSLSLEKLLKKSESLLAIAQRNEEMSRPVYELRMRVEDSIYAAVLLTLMRVYSQKDAADGVQRLSRIMARPRLFDWVVTPVNEWLEHALSAEQKGSVNGQLRGELDLFEKGLADVLAYWIGKNWKGCSETARHALMRMASRLAVAPFESFLENSRDARSMIRRLRDRVTPEVAVLRSNLAVMSAHEKIVRNALRMLKDRSIEVPMSIDGAYKYLKAVEDFPNVRVIGLEALFPATSPASVYFELFLDSLSPQEGRCALIYAWYWHEVDVLLVNTADANAEQKSAQEWEALSQSSRNRVRSASD